METPNAQGFYHVVNLQFVSGKSNKVSLTRLMVRQGTLSTYPTRTAVMIVTAGPSLDSAGA